MTGPMAGAVRLGILSFSAAHPEGRDDEYLRWHLLDHLPEQYSIPQLRLGQRWRMVRSGEAAACREGDPFLGAEHLVSYFFSDPIEEVPGPWFALGKQLFDAGRMPLRLPKVHLGSYELTGALVSPTAAYPVRPEVLAFCSYPAMLVVVERGSGPDADALAELVRFDGVAGVWTFSGLDLPGHFDPSADLAVTLAFAEGPTALSDRINPWVDRRPEVLLSAAYEPIHHPPRLP